MVWDVAMDLHHHGSVQELIQVVLSYGKRPSCPPKVAMWIKEGEVRPPQQKGSLRSFSPIPVVPRDEGMRPRPRAAGAARRSVLLLSCCPCSNTLIPGREIKALSPNKQGNVPPLGRHLGASQMELLFLPSGEP